MQDGSTTSRSRVARHIVLCGPPGVGKGVQARILCDRLGLHRLATGELIRDEIRRETPLGLRVGEAIAGGCFADDETVFSIVLDRLEGASGSFVFDGFPRTVDQARRFDGLLAGRGRRVVELAIRFRAGDSTVLERLAGRSVCSRCGSSYHERFGPPLRPGSCDDCGQPLVRRDDDRVSCLRRRLDDYRSLTAPMEDYYRERKVLVDVDARTGVDVVASRVAEAIRSLWSRPRQESGGRGPEGC